MYCNTGVDDAANAYIWLILPNGLTLTAIYLRIWMIKYMFKYLYIVAPLCYIVIIFFLSNGGYKLHEKNIFYMLF